jgi:maltose-binding protein MalE
MPDFDYTLPMIDQRLAPKLTLLLFMFTLFFSVGCDLMERIEASLPTGEATPTATPLAPEQQPPAIDLPTPTPQETAVAQRTLIIWLPPEIGGRTQTATSVLNEQIRIFSSRYPDLQVMVQQKNVSGPGGMLSYLRTGRSVAPAVMPDLIVLPGDRLLTTYNEELIQPLGGGIDSDLVNALYPAALQVARPQEIVLGYPFALTNMSHLAYDTAVITNTFPLTFTQMLDLPDSSLLYPGSGTEGIIIWLQLYLAHGGTLINEDGQPTLQAEPLQLALEQLSQARQQGFITSQSSNVTNLAEAWQIFEEGGATIVQTTASQFLRERVPGQNYGLTAVPGLTDPLPPLVNSWVWAISTAEPARRSLAIELMTFLVQPDNLAEWSQAAHILPARTDVLNEWTLEATYIQFFEQELQRAQPNPVVSGSQLMNVFRDAVFDVTSLAELPEAAASSAAAVFE